MTDSSSSLYDSQRMINLLDQFAGKNIVLIGDVVADHYIHGNTSRISREAPVLILQYCEETVIPGQVGNTSTNIAGLGGNPFLVSAVAKDIRGDQLLDALSSRQVNTESIIRSDQGATLTKTRILAGGHHTGRQQVIRIDDDRRMELSPEESARILTLFIERAENADAIIVSDYGYGCITPEIWDKAVEIKTRKGIPLVLDSRYKLTEWRGATLITPNEEEAMACIGMTPGQQVDKILSVGEKIRSLTQTEHLLITRGNEGMALFENGKNAVQIPIFGTDECTDVTGAGDTVVATATLALAAGASPLEAAFLANVAGGIVVMKMGTATVSIEEMVQVFSKNDC